jgi:tellurite resistance protein
MAAIASRDLSLNFLLCTKLGQTFGQQAMADQADQDLQRPLDLFKIACCVAWSDGNVSPDETGLLEELIHSHFSQETVDLSLQQSASQLATWFTDLSVLDEVIPRLTTMEDRLLAVKFAYMVASCDQNPCDHSPINPEEKNAYGYLVDALGLDEHQVQELESAADKELQSTTGIKGLKSIFAFLFGGLAS